MAALMRISCTGTSSGVSPLRRSSHARKVRPYATGEVLSEIGFSAYDDQAVYIRP